MPDVADAPDLLAERCVACRRDAPRVTDEEATALTPLIPDWTREEHDGVPRLVRTFRVSTFRDALAFTQRVGELAEEELTETKAELESKKKVITRHCSPSGERRPFPGGPTRSADCTATTSSWPPRPTRSPAKPALLKGRMREAVSRHNVAALRLVSL